LVKLLNGIQYAPTDAGSAGGVVAPDPCDDAEKRSSWAGLVHVIVMAAA
jgi:hypothetical protein